MLLLRIITKKGFFYLRKLCYYAGIYILALIFIYLFYLALYYASGLIA